MNVQEQIIVITFSPSEFGKFANCIEYIKEEKVHEERTEDA